MTKDSPPAADSMPTPETTQDVTFPIPAPDPAVTTGTTAGHPPQQRPDAPLDPRVAELQAMFPDYDDIILLSVLESVQGSQDRAVDVLLRLGDPEYRGEPETTPVPTTQQQVAMSQTDLDEQFARQLLLQEQQQQQIALQGQQSHRSRPQNQQAGSDQQGGDTMAEIQQQFTKIAETGKKTFGTIFSKVKAKIQEMDQTRQGQGSGQTTAAGSRWNAGPNDGYDPALYEQQTYQSQSPQPPYATRPSRKPQQPQTSESSARSVTSIDDSSQATQTVRGYDTTPEHAKESSTSTEPAGAMNASGSSSPPPKTIDGGKFGLLPKRPVSLLRPQSPGTPAAQPVERQDSQDDDDDGLEYTENPFEEGKK